MNRLLLILLAFSPALCQAEAYWVSWDSGWPEEQGWTWDASDQPPQRWLEDGTLCIDSRGPWGIWGGYYQFHPGMFTLEPGETFVLRWRVEVREITGILDPGVMLHADDQFAAGFLLGANRIYSEYEPALSAPIVPGQFHDFVMESSDMRAYRLYIDGGFAFEGAFFDSLVPGSTVAWGDQASNGSLSAWDYFAYGIVPEPSGALCMVAVGTLVSSYRGAVRVDCQRSFP